jgi:hypothetical protein
MGKMSVGEGGGGAPGGGPGEGASTGEREAIKEGQLKEAAPTRPSTLYPHQRRFVDVYGEIRGLGDQEITVERIMDRTVVAQILLAENLERIHEEARLKFEKWLAKRGKELPEAAQTALARSILVREMQTIINRYLCGAYGITGAMIAMYSAFQLHLLKRIKNLPLTLWPGVAEEEIRLWSNRAGMDQRAVRAAAHLVLRLWAHLTHP